jgi:hypothetical protein
MKETKDPLGRTGDPLYWKLPTSTNCFVPRTENENCDAVKGKLFLFIWNIIFLSEQFYFSNC